MTLLKKICKELEIEVGDSWVGNTGKQYKINEYGQVRVWNDEYDEWIESYYNLGHIVNGDLKPKWKPKEGELYYVPSIKKLKDHRFHEGAWLNDDIDNWYMTNNMIFKTKEEAIDCATSMIELAKHGI